MSTSDEWTFSLYLFSFSAFILAAEVEEEDEDSDSETPQITIVYKNKRERIDAFKVRQGCTEILTLVSTKPGVCCERGGGLYKVDNPSPHIGVEN